jgi:iron complex outermembrane recepter protein
MTAYSQYLLACTAVCATAVVSPAAAQTVSFNVPAQSVASAVVQVAQQANVAVVVSGDLADGKRSRGVTGAMSVEQALSRVLASTGLAARQTAARTYVIVPVSAAAAASQTSAATEEAALYDADIIVSAQRRNESVQDVPVAVTVVRGEEIDRRNTTELFDLARSVPGLTVSSFSEAEPIIAVRGASNTFSQAGASKPVGVFIDDVYISRNSASTFQLFDLESVEVLRGPQGTFFGRNVTGGAIVINTAKPDLESTTIKGEVGYGNYDALTLRGLVNGPIGENVAAKISANYTRRDGYSTDRLIDRDVDDLDALAVRGALLFEPTDRISLLLAADYTREKSNGRAISATNPASADDGDPRTAELGIPQSYDRDGFGISATAKLETGVGVLTSITAYRESDAFEDLAFSPVAFQLLPSISPTFPFQRTTQNRDKPSTFSQELRLVSAGDSRFGYVAGLYFFQEDITRDARTLQYAGRTGTLIRDWTFFQDVSTKSYAAYLNLSYEVTDWLTAHLGGRYTFEKKSVDVDYVDALNPARSFSDARFKDDYDQFTPRLAIEAKPVDNLMLYASYTKGFTAGGFNTEEPSVAVITAPFAPETIDSFEAGFKSQFFDRRLTLNVAGFLQNYDDKQEGFLTPTFNFVIQNASKATVRGVEVEARYAITPTVALSGSYAYLDATYDRFVVNPTDDRSGNLLASSPKHAFSLGLDAQVPLAEGIDLVGNANYSWQDDYYTGSENRPTFLIDSYGLARASIGLQHPTASGGCCCGPTTFSISAMF